MEWLPRKKGEFVDYLNFTTVECDVGQWWCLEARALSFT